MINPDKILELETRLDELFNDFKNSAMQLDQIDAAIESLEVDQHANLPTIEMLYAKEFSLSVDNSSIYEDLEKLIQVIKSKDPDNFKARRLEKDLEKYLRVCIIDL